MKNFYFYFKCLLRLFVTLKTTKPGYLFQKLLLNDKEHNIVLLRNLDCHDITTKTPLTLTVSFLKSLQKS